MKALIIGLGSIGLRHLRNLYQLGVHDLAVFRTRGHTPPGKMPEGEVKEFFDFPKALQERPDLVFICNPTSEHIKFLEPALEANCHVYCEKPLSHRLEGLEKIERLRVKKNLVVSVGCQLRFHPHLIQIHEILNQNKLGKLLSVVCDMGEYLPDWHPWEDYRKSYAARSELGGGVLFSQIHDLNYLNWFFGPLKPQAAFQQKTPLETDVEDNISAIALNQNGLPVQIRMDYWRKPPVRTLNIVGSQGAVLWDYHARTLTVWNRDSKRDEFSLPNHWERNSLFLDCAKDFLKCVTERCAPRTSFFDGVEDLKLAKRLQEMIQKSTPKSKSAQPCVDLPTSL